MFFAQKIFNCRNFLLGISPHTPPSELSRFRYNLKTIEDETYATDSWSLIKYKWSRDSFALLDNITICGRVVGSFGVV
jgi:hypothetical protein